jgi:4-hydroxybenzoate polyprenyltransferase
MMPGMAPVAALVRAAHAVPAASVTTLVVAATAARGASIGALLLATLSTAASQLSVGWSNDYLDRDEDRAAGRLEKPLVAGRVDPRTLWVGAWIAAAVCLGSAALLGPGPAAAMAVALAAAWAYNIGLKRTPLSWLPYAVAFGLAPVFVWLVADGRLPPAWVPAVTAALGIAGHLTNALPDLERDRAVRARGLPHLLGPTASLISASVLLGGITALILARAGPLSLWAVAAGSGAAVFAIAVVVAGLLGRARLAFLMTIACAGAVVTTFLLTFRG